MSHESVRGDIDPILGSFGQESSDIDISMEPFGYGSGCFDFNMGSFGHGSDGIDLNMGSFGYGRGCFDLNMWSFGHGSSGIDLNIGPFGHGSDDIDLRMGPFGHEVIWTDRCGQEKHAIRKVFFEQYPPQCVALLSCKQILEAVPAVEVPRIDSVDAVAFSNHHCAHCT